VKFFALKYSLGSISGSNKVAPSKPTHLSLQKITKLVKKILKSAKNKVTK